MVKRKPLTREVSVLEGRHEGGVDGAAVPTPLKVYWLSLPKGTSRSLKVRTRKKAMPSDMDS